MELYRLWDFLTARGESIISEWVKNDRLSKRDRIILNHKLDILVQQEFSRVIKTKLLAGPIYGHIYKLHVKGDVQLRPLLCRGPVDNETEYTLLRGAVEIGWKLPKGCEKQAEENRQTVIDNPLRRCAHEPII